MDGKISIIKTRRGNSQKSQKIPKNPKKPKKSQKSQKIQSKFWEFPHLE